MQLLNGVSFGPIADLGIPDGLLVIAGRTFHILPVIMTAVNLISCIIFTKGSPLKSKIQLYAMAVFFLFFLYTSPSGLVLYWTLNNIFSLVKTIFYKLKNPGKVLAILASIVGAVIFIYGLFFYHSPSLIRPLFFAGCGILMQLPFLYIVFSKRMDHVFKSRERIGNKKAFFAGGIFLTVLTGVWIPSSVLQSSPQEFIDIAYFYHPLWFIVSSLCLAAGIFVVWLGIFYWLAKPASRYYFDQFIWILSGVAILDYMFFGKNLGILSPSLVYETGLVFTKKEQLANLAAVFFAAAIFYLIYKNWKKLVTQILVVGILAMGVLSSLNLFQINASINEVKEQLLTRENAYGFTLSKTGKNVIVLMLDRAMGEYVPYLFREKPELKEQFSGFVYYANTISFGPLTNFGTPAIFGGYEYTPMEMNKRSDEPLVSKHNEALKVMPVLFDNHDYEVSVVSPPYANYQWISDLSIYNDYPEIQCSLTVGAMDRLSAERRVQDNSRNFFCYSILKSVPLCIQKVVYNGGQYNQEEAATEGTVYAGQVAADIYTAAGMNAEFMKHYQALAGLSESFTITDEETNTFLLLTNDLTHEPMMLQEPDYVPAQQVNNTAYEAENQDRFTLEGRTLKMETEQQVIHYQTNMAAMLQLGKLFDYMRENGVYDNTRIILVSDHGRNLEHIEEFLLEDGEDISLYYPLLMVKDFGKEGFTISEEFMTNGDVPTLAMDGIIPDPHNPFTGKAIDSSAKSAPVQYIIGSRDWDVNTNNGNTFLPSIWYSVHDDMRDRENWKRVADDAILPVIE